MKPDLGVECTIVPDLPSFASLHFAESLHNCILAVTELLIGGTSSHLDLKSNFFSQYELFAPLLIQMLFTSLLP